MRSRSGQFIIITAVIILLIIVLLVADIHQTSIATQSPPPIYAAVESVNQSIQTVLGEVLANYSHEEVIKSACGDVGSYTPTADQPLSRLLSQELDNLTLIYSDYGLLFDPVRPVYTVSWCTGQLGGGSTAVAATLTFNLTKLGLSGFRDQIVYSLSAYSLGCTLNTANLTCWISVFEQASTPVTNLNQSYFYLSQPAGWVQAQSVVDYDNGTYSVSWILATSPPLPFSVQVAVENMMGVYVLTYSSASAA